MADENSGSQDNLYSPDSQDLDSQTRSPAEVLRIAIDNWIRDNMNVRMPGQVVRVRNNSFVDVQPMIQEEYKVQGMVTLPVLQNIPIEHLRGNTWWIKAPVQVGDLGAINFYDRSLDNYLVQGGITNPEDTRQHDISDATFTPGLYPSNNILPGEATDLVFANGLALATFKATGETQLQNKNGAMTMYADGTFSIENTNANQELFQNLITLISTLIESSTVAGGPFINATIEQLEQILDNLTEMQGG